MVLPLGCHIFGGEPLRLTSATAKRRLGQGPHEVSSFGTEALLLHLLDVEHRGTSWNYSQWEFQDPTDGGTLVPYVWPYFVGIFPEIKALKNRPYIW